MCNSGRGRESCVRVGGVGGGVGGFNSAMGLCVGLCGTMWKVVWEDPTLPWEDNSAAMGGWQGLWELPQWLTARTKWPFH